MTADFSRRNPFKPVGQTATLKEAAQRLAAGAHRVPVVGADGRVVNIISQSSIVDFYYHHKARTCS
jgi:CBS-domain-containing membrane protein